MSRDMAIFRLCASHGRELNDAHEQIAKLKNQVAQLLERCEAAEKPADHQWVVCSFLDLKPGDLIAYIYQDTDVCGPADEDLALDLCWRAEPYDLMNEHGVSKAVIKKLKEMRDELSTIKKLRELGGQDV